MQSAAPGPAGEQTLAAPGQYVQDEEVDMAGSEG